MQKCALLASLMLDPSQVDLVTGLVSGTDFADPDMGHLLPELRRQSSRIREHSRVRGLPRI